MIQGFEYKIKQIISVSYSLISAFHTVEIKILQKLGEFLVDDRTKNGAREFKGEFIHFGTTRFPDWAAVKKYLKEKA